MTFRQTAARPTRLLEGVGLHSGSASSVRILPSASGGIRFRDIASGQEIAALCENVADTRRCTVLQSGGATVQTVEHVLSALAGLGVTDAIVEYEGVELPALDGSAQLYVQALAEAGFTQLEQAIEPIVLVEPIVVTDGETVITAVPAESSWRAVTLSYPDKPAMTGLSASQSAGTDYTEEIAPARTYGFVSELAYLVSKGLALGASADNAVALNDSGAADPRTPLRFENELARHKLLDLIGDLSLCGRPVTAGIIAYRPSHSMNVSLARRICAAAEQMS